MIYDIYTDQGNDVVFDVWQIFWIPHVFVQKLNYQLGITFVLFPEEVVFLLDETSNK